MSQPGMLSVMRECRNFFEATSETGVYTITSSVIDLQGGYLPGQYILITGSSINNGLYLLTDTAYTLDMAQDETFIGIIYGLRVPADFVTVCNEIKTFNDSEMGKPTNIVSENVLGVHSYSLGIDKSGIIAGWQAVFSSRLAPFRRMFSDIKI